MVCLGKTVHNLLGFPDPDDRCRSNPRRCRHVPSSFNAVGLRCLAREPPIPGAHVVESAAVPPRAHLSSRRGPEEGIGEEGPGSGCLYGRSGGAGLELCTESLGFESCCDGWVGEGEKRAEQEIRGRIEECKRRPPSELEKGDEVVRRREQRPTRRMTTRTTEAKEFPPPLPSLGAGSTSGGRSRSFLKAVKTDGRLVLTEVRVELPEILRASRQGGRLRLELVKSEPEQPEEENKSAEEEEEEEGKEEETVAGEAAEVVAAAEKKEEEVVVMVVEQRWWQVPAPAMERRREGGEVGRGRCEEMVRSGLPASPFWGARFVTTA